MQPSGSITDMSIIKTSLHAFMSVGSIGSNDSDLLTGRLLIEPIRWNTFLNRSTRRELATCVLACCIYKFSTYTDTEAMPPDARNSVDISMLPTPTGLRSINCFRVCEVYSFNHVNDRVNQTCSILQPIKSANTTLQPSEQPSHYLSLSIANNWPR
jgi:hypothetical protein